MTGPTGATRWSSVEGNFAKISRFRRDFQVRPAEFATSARLPPLCLLTPFFNPCTFQRPTRRHQGFGFAAGVEGSAHSQGGEDCVDAQGDTDPWAGSRQRFADGLFRARTDADVNPSAGCFIGAIPYAWPHRVTANNCVSHHGTGRRRAQRICIRCRSIPGSLTSDREIGPGLCCIIRRRLGGASRVSTRPTCSGRIGTATPGWASVTTS